MSPMAKTSWRPLTANDSSVWTEPSFSKLIAELSLRKPVAGATPTPRITRSAGRDVPSFSLTAPTALGFFEEGVAESTEADMWNLTPFAVSFSWKILPSSAPMTRSRGADSIPITETELLGASALPTSMPIKEEPTTTTFFFFSSPMALRMAWTSGMDRRRKTLDRSLKPGRGRALGVPPVERMSFVYLCEEPEAVETVLALKSTPETSSEMVSIEDVLYQSFGRRTIFDSSAMSALESLVRSMGRFGSLEINVTEPLNPCSRRPWTAPMAPLPLSCTIVSIIDCRMKKLLTLQRRRPSPALALNTSY